MTTTFTDEQVEAALKAWRYDLTCGPPTQSAASSMRAALTAAVQAGKPTTRFSFGDKVIKFSGDYGGPGVVVGTFPDESGKPWVAWSFKPEGGFGKCAHFLREHQLKLLEAERVEPPLPAAERHADKLLLMLAILRCAGGTADASDHKDSWFNYFCNDSAPLDTFNRASNGGYTRVTHDNDYDTSAVYLTDKGREYLSASESLRGQGRADDGWQLVPKALRDEIDNLIKIWQDAPYGTSFGRYMENALSKLCAERDKLALAASPSSPVQAVEGPRELYENAINILTKELSELRTLYRDANAEVATLTQALADVHSSYCSARAKWDLAVSRAEKAEASFENECLRTRDLATELAEAKKVIEPFAKYADDKHHDGMPNSCPLFGDDFLSPTIGHLRAARTWLDRNKT